MKPAWFFLLHTSSSFNQYFTIGPMVNLRMNPAGPPGPQGRGRCWLGWAKKRKKREKKRLDRA
jgi:hypothetical protein